MLFLNALFTRLIARARKFPVTPPIAISSSAHEEFLWNFLERILIELASFRAASTRCRSAIRRWMVQNELHSRCHCQQWHNGRVVCCLLSPTMQELAFKLSPVHDIRKLTTAERSKKNPRLQAQNPFWSPRKKVDDSCTHGF